ncbi:phosphoribosylanthranilate isomerase [Pelagibacterium sp. 26DY04]|uniref:phosphoribosylanthranilate isomerase n=1 Tax=Pelagibacterium sp. 26DY04 TaxID=2967130 RepID=UPI0028168F01|nr:phosphoribosylanthranilate isomerase [Pelagibacterium sp. 26DY04]WMT87269.1 phosphoribosylanthranilate isomerase [Pelagibacterium sp. 26DY04]
MSAPIIKICGVSTPDILDHVIAQGADMVGFVHFAKSPRHLPFNEIANLVSRAGDRIETAILLVDPDNDTVAAAADTGVHWLQLHGSENKMRTADIRERSGLKIIKALPVGDEKDIRFAPTFRTVSDRLILDAKPPKDTTRPGGLGKTFDWTLLEGLDRSLPFMLSGGLTIDNVSQAVRTVRPFGLDVSSGVEREKGVKDADLITAFMSRAREAAADGN